MHKNSDLLEQLSQPNIAKLVVVKSYNSADWIKYMQLSTLITDFVLVFSVRPVHARFSKCGSHKYRPNELYNLIWGDSVLAQSVKHAQMRILGREWKKRSAEWKAV